MTRASDGSFISARSITLGFFGAGGRGHARNREVADASVVRTCVVGPPTFMTNEQAEIAPPRTSDQQDLSLPRAAASPRVPSSSHRRTFEERRCAIAHPCALGLRSHGRRERGRAPRRRAPISICGGQLDPPRSPAPATPITRQRRMTVRSPSCARVPLFLRRSGPATSGGCGLIVTCGSVVGSVCMSVGSASRVPAVGDRKSTRRGCSVWLRK